MWKLFKGGSISTAFGGTQGETQNPRGVKSRNTSADEQNMQMIRQSGLFDLEWYLKNYPDVQEQEVDPLQHYYYRGAGEGRSPNYLFDSAWYLEQNPDVAQAGVNPLLHYVQFGEREGRLPSVYFEPRFYRIQVNQEQVPPCLLADYMSGGWRRYAPNEYFAPVFYLQQQPDIAEARIDPLRHYIFQGWREKREINPTHSFEEYRAQLEARLGRPVEPLGYYLRVGKTNGEKLPGYPDREKRQQPAAEKLWAEIERAHVPGPWFEERLQGNEVTARAARARLFAFYLPQFHPTRENDGWWGTGFTEWRNVTRAYPRFEGHQQPRLPRDLGFYDLRNIETIRAQVAMARASGVAGFCFYYYWFNRKRLLEQPINLFLKSRDIEFPFCLMWANENWTRRWDGLEQDVLMQQDYHPQDDEALIDDLARHFKDPRYERVSGRPLFFIYRPGIIPEFRERLGTWRMLFKERHQLEPLILMALGFGDHDPVRYGLDGAVEFPPHKLAVGLPAVHESLNLIDSGFGGHYMHYDDLVARSLSADDTSFPLIRTVVPSWDNEARKPNRGMGFVAADPDKYEMWLRSLTQQAMKKPFLGQTPYVFVNAWNEWAEGAVLEPDLANGCAYLNATYRALTGVSKSRGAGTQILLIGHDAHLHGAQLLTLNILRTLRHDFGVEVTLLLLEGGPLVQQYREWGTVIVASERKEPLEDLLATIAPTITTQSAICNTVVTGHMAKALASRGFRVVTLVHELSRLIRERRLEDRALAVAEHSEKVVFASAFVQRSFEEITAPLHGKACIRPQGIYQDLKRDPTLRTALRERLGLPPDAKIVLNMGFGDLRKGFDLYVGLAKQVLRRNDRCHFVWLGKVHEDLMHWLSIDMNNEPLLGHFHVLDFDQNVEPYLNGADVFALTSREDPFPSVVLEALACGVPVAAFAGGGGYTDAIDAVPEGGKTAPMGDVLGLAGRVVELLGQNQQQLSESRARAAIESYSWREYVFGLLELAMPALHRVSVVVVNYNYAHCLPERVGSILKQSYPIYELLFLDDCSTDNSVEVAEALGHQYKRRIQIVPNTKNSGSVFSQWEKGARLARGDFIWIAEADDLASDGFIGDLLHEFDEKTVLGFCDSSQIDLNGARLGESYAFYYKDLPANPMTATFRMKGRKFVSEVLSIKNAILNVSGVIFRRDALLSIFDRSGPKISEFKVAGDWRIYSEILAQPDSNIAYVNKPNNIHRRHASSVTHTLNAERHIEEIALMQQYIRDHTQVSDEAKSAAARHLEDAATKLRSHRIEPPGNKRIIEELEERLDLSLLAAIETSVDTAATELDHFGEKRE